MHGLMQDCAFHPNKRIVAAGLVDGGIRVIDCSGAELRDEGSVVKHRESCRSVEFDGNMLLSGSADKSVMVFDIEARKVVARMKQAHDCAIER